MATSVAMPRLGMKMTEGTVVAWRVTPGDAVEPGTPVLVIESDKSEVEIEARTAGFVRHIYVQAGETVACGTVLVALTETRDEPFEPALFRRESGEKKPEFVAAPDLARAKPVSPRASGAPVTPAARRRASELDVDVTWLVGSGPGGRVTREDVEAAVRARAARSPVAPGVALEVERSGEGPPVLLLPGFGADATSFALQRPALARSYEVLALHPRAVGLSDAPACESYTVDEAARDAAAVIGAPAHVVGASLGAAVALELALAAPEKVRSLALLTPFARADATLLAVVEAWCRIAREASADTLARFLLPWLFSNRQLEDAVRRERALRGLTAAVPRTSPEALERHAAGLRAWSGRRAGDLARLRVPTLVVVAGADRLTPGGEALAAQIPAAKLVVVPGAGHAVALEAAEAVNEALLEHLAALPRG